jgi:Flp pilus assembly protein TadD
VIPFQGPSKSRLINILFAALIGAGSVFLVGGAALSTTFGKEDQPAASRISIDYPLNGSVFPPEITPPTFLWHDPESAVKHWMIEVSFADGSKSIRVRAVGEPLQVGEIDPGAGPALELTPDQATTRTWKPDGETWATIKRLTVKAPATVSITGFADEETNQPVSVGRVTISTSADPVGAPLFYRDVPLRTSAVAEAGPIAPLPLSAIPLIKWRVRNLAEPESHVVMTDLPTCANCHSFSRDGKTFGLDLDGPRNDKGLYALVPVSPKMTIRNQDVIHWSSFQLNSEASASSPAVKRFGFMSQVSPDGRYVVTSIGPPDNTSKNKEQIHGMAAGLLDRLYSINYKDFRFLQVFYPMRGILAWYDRKEGTMRPLPGADDPQFVQASAFWSPDGKYLIFSRAVARDPFPPGAPKPEYANDPREPQIQYDLYKIPFNEGRGGKAVPIKGASANGMSNNFPKVSPDGKWIVFVQNKNGLLMRPDSRLFIVPFEGGKARLMNCNLSLMNSWHTFSPDGHWLAFSSKARGPFTRLMLTHIDSQGNDTPAIIVDNTTAANRAVNIPEFVNVPPDGGLEAINPQATEFYKLVDNAFKLAQGGRVPEAIQVLRSALELDPDDAMAHYNLGTLLVDSGQPQASLEEYRKASTLSPEDSTFAEHYGVSLAANGEWKEAIANLQKAVALEPTSATFQFNLGFVTERSGDYAGAVSPLEKAVELSQGKNSRFLAELAKVYDKTGRDAEAVQTAQKALNLATQEHDQKRESDLRNLLARHGQASSQTRPQ